MLWLHYCPTDEGGEYRVMSVNDELFRSHCPWLALHAAADAAESVGRVIAIDPTCARMMAKLAIDSID